MLLEERRSVIKHILLNIITLGLYGLYATAELARDTNVACYGDGKHSKFGTREMIFSIFTGGLYQALWMMGLIARWNSFFRNGSRGGRPVNAMLYLICRLSVVGSFIGLSACYRKIGELCEDFNDAFFRMDENDPFAKKAKKIIEEVAEKRQNAGNDGYNVIEEYDFASDRRRLDHTAEEAARAALLAELEEEERREAANRIAEEIEAEAKAEEEKERAAANAHRNKRWFRPVFLGLLAIFLLPVIVISVITFAFPAVYNDTFVGELGEKYDRLKNTDEPKIVVIGGSSVAFGLDSEMMSDHLGMEVVNFGLYANLGTKLMLDLSKCNINEGDIIVIAPEMNSQTLSLYFNAETAIQAMDGNWEMLPYVGTDDYESLIGAMWKFAGEKLNYVLTGTAPENSGAYKKEWFNEYGDNTFDRPYNTMVSTSKTISLDFRTNYNDNTTSEYEQFIDYVNEYIAFCNNKGATVYFSFAPMNEAAMTDYNTAENVYNFYRNLCASVNCRVISDVTKCVMDEGYFFDSEFHLNNAGVTVRTAQLIDDIKREMGEVTITLSKNELPNPPGFAPMDIVGGDSENLYFVLEQIMVDSKDAEGNDIKIPVWAIVGLNDNGLVQETITIPNNVDGAPITIIRANAFAGSLLETLYIGENISAINANAFSGASSLKSVYIPASKSDPESIIVPNKMDAAGLATNGAPKDMKIYVPESGLEAYKAGYLWGDYGSYLLGYNPEEK